ncbi:MAG: hypothetical protein ACYC2W_06180, partial [Desulfurivibrionaceae bacterium]
MIQRNRSGVSAAQVAYYFACKAAINGYIHIDPILKQDTMRWVVNSGHENSTQLFAVDKTGAHMQPGKDNRVFSVFFGGYK